MAPNLPVAGLSIQYGVHELAMPTKNTGQRWVASILAVLTCLSLPFAGSAATKKPKKGAEPVLELAWPEPPEQPRIKFVDILIGEANFGRKTSWRDSFRGMVTGTKAALTSVYQPRDIEVSDDGNRIYASDFAQGLVFIFDFEAKKVNTINVERPFGLALDDKENLYIAEQQPKRIRVLDRQQNLVRMITDPKLARPTDIAIDRTRHLLYVADPAKKDAPEHTVKVFDLEGHFVRAIGNGKGDCEGCLYFPTFLALDRDGNLYVTSTLNARVDEFTPEGKYVKTIGGRGTAFGMFDKPKGVALDSFNNVYVVDSGWSNIQIFNQKGEVLLFFGGRGGYPGLLKNPTGITIDKNNKIYVADFLNARISVYQLVNTKADDSYLKLPAEPPAPSTTKDAKLAAGGTQK